MLASIIICTRNRCAALRETIQAVRSLAIPDGLAIELLVVDNGSTDDTPAYLAGIQASDAALRVVYEPRRGQSLARNTGIAAARGEIIVFTDDDIVPSRDWLAALVAPIAGDRLDFVAGTVTLAPHLLRPWMTQWHRSWLASTDYINPESPEAAVGANMAFSRRVLRAVPAFDVNLGPGQLGLYDDTLFFKQVRESGGRTGMAREAVVEHHFSPERLKRGSFINHAINQGRSLAYLSWHWEHERHNLLWPKVQRRRFLLWLKRSGRKHSPEGLPEWEMADLIGLSFLKQFRIECRSPRIYARHGTIEHPETAGRRHIRNTPA